MSSKITQFFRRTIFPTRFITYRVKCHQSPKHGLFYLPFSRTLKSWSDLHELSRNQLELLRRTDAVFLEPEKKRKVTEVENTGENKRRWTVNSAILDAVRKHVYFVDLEKTNVPLLNMILRGDFVTLYGARASGKSTRVFQIMEKLKNLGIVCIYVTFEQCNMATIDTFWSTFGAALHITAPKYFGKDDVKSATDFMMKLAKEHWNDNHVVLFIDEFDTLFEAHDEIKSSFLRTIRAIKTAKNYDALLSSVAIGPFSILNLSSERMTTSPFNIKESFRNPNFTLEQVQTVFKEFENEFNLTIDPEIIEDIYNRTNGHAALVCLCGKNINSHLMSKLDENRRLRSSTWLNFVISSMGERIFDYSTFRRMITSLRKEEFRPAIELLRSAFLGFFDFEPIHSLKERKLAEFLTAEGVLIRDEVVPYNFRMSSIFVDDLIRREVIPVLYESAPICAVPRKGNSLDTLKILQMAIQFFDKPIIFNGFTRSFKIAHALYVDGEKKRQVPREGIYDSELNRVLINWLAINNGIQVTGQWHLIESHTNEKDEHTYSDIVITTKRQIIVLEILATASESDLNNHFEIVLAYANKLFADDIWIVHFTCEDRYSATHEKLQWPSDSRINVIHCYHNEMLKDVLMNIRYVDSSGIVKYITNQRVELLS
ncbi:transcriptional regulator [Gigaspora margarita]|uniref:Transcriptional regulator n=1 Tax=Gigaspora margarita TaxID=4874 RepID=A0A8H4EMT4_GIGMA|nr:transcriptional regulator [Gigaspora margarita]